MENEIVIVYFMWKGGEVFQKLCFSRVEIILHWHLSEYFIKAKALVCFDKLSGLLSKHFKKTGNPIKSFLTSRRSVSQARARAIYGSWKLVTRLIFARKMCRVTLYAYRLYFFYPFLSGSLYTSFAFFFFGPAFEFRYIWGGKIADAADRLYEEGSFGGGTVVAPAPMFLLLTF